MKNNALDDIVKCDIEISSPASSDASFDTILMIVPGPTGSGDLTMKKVTAVSKADELIDYGFTTVDAAYIAAAVAFSQSPSPDEIYICIRETMTSEDGTVSNAGIKETLIKAASECGFYGIYIAGEKTAEDIVNAVEWAEANEKLFGFEYTDYENFPVQNTNYYRSFAVYSGDADGYEDGEQPKENRCASLAWMAKCFGYDPGTETWHLKELATLVPSALTTDQKKTLAGQNINTFLRYGGCNVTIGGYTLAGEWTDVIRFRDWIKNEMQINAFNALKVNRKVPFTDQGIGLIEGKIIETLLKGQSVGGIAPDEYDADDNLIPGFSVTVPLASDLTEEQRKSRVLTGCNWSARLAGAIHAVEISGFLSF